MLAAALLFGGFSHSLHATMTTIPRPARVPTIELKNMVAVKNYVQSGTIDAVAPGASTTFSFHAGKRASA